MLLYSTEITSRLQYIVSFISNELFDEPIIITNNLVGFIEYKKPKINYSQERITGNEFFIQPVSLLFEKNIESQNIVVATSNHRKAFYFVENSDFHFDVFAASFYLLSRYEEYLPHTLDEYCRFAHTNSLAFKESFLHEPLINYWLIDFKKSLQQKFPGLQFRQQQFNFIPTYDIDIAWKYRHKDFKRTAGSLLKYLVTGKWNLLAERIAVLQNKATDPHDPYQWLEALHTACNLKPYYFFLLAKKQMGYDKNIHPSKTALQHLILYHIKKAIVGIHPSWQSGDNCHLLNEEIDCLKSITKLPVKHSRQHYIRFALPVTFRRLIEAGIEKDFSMGYGSINGFRASVASSFYWYDLEKEETTGLRLFPFCFMEANSFYEQKYSSAQAHEELIHYYKQLREVKGLMITIWHNNTLGTDEMFVGWPEMYEKFLKETVQK